MTLGYPTLSRPGGQPSLTSGTDVDRAWRRLRTEASSSGFRREPRDGETLEQYRLALREFERQQAEATRLAMGDTLKRFGK